MAQKQPYDKRIKTTAVVFFIGFLSWAYRNTCSPPPPKPCGSAGGPPVTGPRVRLRDGRHLAYNEYGVSKHVAKYKILFVHGFGSCRYDESVFHQEVFEELKIYMVTFDRPGYGESDPHPKRTIQSLALDMEELADNLMELGNSKFYVIGYSMGQQGAWGSLNYIPHRLAGVALISPVVNYWWSSFPRNLTMAAYKLQPLQDQWAVGVSHYMPSLVYWWNTQKWFPGSSVIAGKPNFSPSDWKLLAHQGSPTPRSSLMAYATQQGPAESIFRDMSVGFGKWEFDPMEIENPFPNNEGGSVHLWHGDEDGLVPVSLQRYIAKKLPWIHYHELPGVGHLLPIYNGNKEAILKSLLVGEH